MFSLMSGKNLVGLDIGASAIKLVTGKKTKTGFSVDKLAIVPLPYKAIDERGIVNGEKVVAALTAAFGQLNSKNTKVATAVRGAGVLTKRIILSHFPKKEIPDQVRWEAEQVFPTDISTIFIDHILLGESSSLPGAPVGTKGWDILLVGVRQDIVQNLQNVVEAAGAEAKLIDIDSLVIGDFLEESQVASKEEAVAFVDMGASATRVAVRHRGHVVFIREFLLGGHAFTEAIAAALGLSFEDAESLKIHEGMGIPQEAHEALKGVLGQWRQELQQCEDVFVTQESQALVRKWVLFGGASLTPGLMDFIKSDGIGERVHFLASQNFFQAGHKSVDAQLLSAWAPRLFTAAGLACRKTS